MNVALVLNPIVEARAVRAYDALPGVVPFAQMLQAQNRVRRIEPVDTYEPSSSAPSATLPSASLLPKLGEVLAVDPEPKTRTVISEQRQMHIPATGRVLDLYI